MCFSLGEDWTPIKIISKGSRNWILLGIIHILRQQMTGWVGQKKVQNHADVIYGWSLNKQIHSEIEL